MDSAAGTESDEMPALPLLGGKYEIVREIGRGGMGVVYEGRNTWTHRRVALKVLHRDVGSVVRERLFEEARTASSLVHPCIVSVLDMGAADDGSLYLVQELLVGEDLQQRLASRGALPARAALEMFRALADALAVAHASGIVHRDVKPSNIVLTTSSRGETVPKLVDFGIATRLGERSNTRLTTGGTLVGTPHYMAPERIVDRADADGRADVWALGVCLHEALAGATPFRATRLHQVLIEVTRFDSRTAPLSQAIPPHVETVVRAALRADPGERPSMRQLERMIDDALRAGEGQDVLEPDPTIRERLALHETLDGSDPLASTGSLDAISLPRASAPALRIGLVVTARDVDALRFGDAFSAALARRCEIRRFASYSALVDAVSEDDVELAWLPPVAYVRAARTSAARLLVTVEREGRTAYASALLGRRGLVRTWEDVRGRRAAWVDGWSAAGYLVPRWMLRERGIDPDLALRSQVFLGSYDAVLEALASGAADVGAAFCTLGAGGAILRRPWGPEHGLDVIGLSDPIPGDTFCASPHIAESTFEELREILADRASAMPLLQLVGASGLAIGDPARYASLERALLATSQPP